MERGYIHQKFEKCLLENDEKNIIRTSTKITNKIDKIIGYLQHESLKIVFYEGDCILCKCEAVDVIDLCNYLSKIGSVNTTSAGVGIFLKRHMFLSGMFAKGLTPCLVE